MKPLLITCKCTHSQVFIARFVKIFSCFYVFFSFDMKSFPCGAQKHVQCVLLFFKCYLLAQSAVNKLLSFCHITVGSSNF